MGKKISNEVRMTGVLPSQGADPIPVGKIPDGGTQVVKQEGVAGGSVNVHTVTGAKTLYLSALAFSVRNESTVAGTAAVNVSDATPTQQYTIFTVNVAAGSGLAVSIPFFPPLEIQAGWIISVYSGVAECTAYLFIHGYEA